MAPPQSATNADLIPLMQRYQAADPEAADELVRRLNPILARYFYALTVNARLVEDLLQECWLRIHRARHSYRPPEPVLPWILAIARHTRIDQFRCWQRSSGREANWEDLPGQLAADPRADIETRLAANSILAELKDLPEAQREVLLMLKVAGMTIDEVARAIGSTPAAVKQKAYRAYQTLRSRLNPKEDTP